MTYRKRKSTFVLIVPRFEDIFHSYYAGEIIHGTSLSASRLNADFLIHITDRSDHRGWVDSSLLDRNFVDGILFADIDNDVTLVKNVARYGMPYLVLNNYFQEPINYVAVDNRTAAYEAVRFLIQQGHQQIATIAGDMGTQSGLQRLEGYRDAMRDHKLVAPRSYTTFGDFLRTPARNAALRLMRLKKRPTAVFVASDVMAMELMDVARNKNLDIPRDLSVIGFDDNPLIQASSVPLTTVSQPLREMGRVGAEQLALISRGKTPLPVKITLETKLIKRASTAKIPKK